MRASYRAAVAWIAENDAPGDPGAQSPVVVAGYVSTLLVADLFGKPELDVAVAIVRYRLAHKIGESA